jgi:hypothetical protein
MSKKIVEWFRSNHVRQDIAGILHLSLIQRLTHAKSRRIMIATSSGIILMLGGTVMSQNADGIEHVAGIHGIFVDTAGYFIHGVGAVPLMRYFEPLWTLVMGSEG